MEELGNNAEEIVDVNEDEDVDEDEDVEVCLEEDIGDEE